MPPVAPWSVKGIDPRARAVAKSAARREGMTLGEWLNRVILDDGASDAAKDWDDQLSNFPGFGGGGGGGSDDDGRLGELVQRLSDRLEAAERRSTLALSSVDQSVAKIAQRIEDLEENQDDGDETHSALSRARAQQDELLDRVRRLERAGPGAGADPAALKTVETTVGKIAERLYETERDVRTELDNLSHKEERRRDSTDKGLEKLGRRLDEADRKTADETRALRDMVETRDQRTQTQLNGLDESARSLQSRIIAAESATQRAAEALAQSQEKLDTRLRDLEQARSEAVTADDVKTRIDALAREVADVIRDTRAEAARQIAEVSKSTDTQRLERALTAAEARMSAAENRQSSALQRIGTEVARLTKAVDQRLDRTERRLQQRLDEAEAKRQSKEDRKDLETRLEQVRSDNTTAMKRIGEQVAKLGENLADRVNQAEQRSADAVQAAGERMAQVVERLEQTRTQSNEADLEQRIKDSEERTAARIDKAMDGVHERLDQARKDTSDALSPVQRAMTALAERLEAIEDTSKKSKSKEAVQTVETVREAADALSDFSKPLPEAPDRWVSSSEDEVVAPLTKGDSFEISAAPRLPQTPAPASQSTASQEPLKTAAPLTSAETVQTNRAPAQPARPGATADADFLARARKQVRSNRGSEAGWDPSQADKPKSQNRTLLFTASAVGVIAVASLAGMLVFEAVTGPSAPVAATDPSASLSDLFAEPASAPAPALETPSVASEPAQPADLTAGAASAMPTETGTSSEIDTSSAQPQATQTATPAPSAPAPTPAPVVPQGPTLESAAAEGNPIARYQLALQHAQASEFADAAALMRRAAEQGVPAAQFEYALMLRDGRGVGADLLAARGFMEQAAEAGHVQAMLETGSLYIQTQATPEDQATAARWFEQGALHGLVDSQVNIALLFQDGFGVPQSAADAYAWFTIAGLSGDAEARERAAGLRPEIGPEQRAAAEAVAQSFTPRVSEPAVQGNYPAQAWDAGTITDRSVIAQVQAQLSQLGYQPGPADGLMGGRTRDAIAAFRQDQGLPAGNTVDAALVAQLARVSGG